VDEPYDKTIICLANSRKISGRCIAGKIIEGQDRGNWLRPISGRPTGELSEEDRRYKDGTTPKLGDIISIPLRSPQQHAFQPENHLIDDRYYWELNRIANWSEIRSCVDNVRGTLWDNSSSGYNGIHDRIIETEAANVVKKYSSSLKLIEVTDFVVQISVEGAQFDNAKRKVRGRFSCAGHNYLLAITDPIIERQYLSQNDGTYNVGNSILCISIGEPFHGYVYKLIAAIFVPPQG
jgi:hypothetical protein